ncbi:hypothetical protein [Sphingosinicella sp. BN140058]|uniref:hypothetical protein n=1 Tax=Sphingosinicella sp. BN140058 TaxID=1892855 RepID=UPI00101111C5|nr:hypothetical protein [Sphingosinicella sp. BN140058]QAY78434.1 hypothetical protein ETR14_19245 [Sphingosinicella sp. BN140058]
MKLSIVASILLACPSIVNGQLPAEQNLSDEAEVAARVPLPPSGRTDNLLNGVSFDLAVSENDSAASMEYGEYTVRQGLAGSRQLNESWALKLSVPIGGKDDLTSGATLDALSNGPKASFTYSFFSFNPGPRYGGKFHTIMRHAREECASAPQPPETPKDCKNAGPSQQFAEKYSTTYSDVDIARSLFSPIWRFGVTSSIGFKRHEYIVPASITSKNQTKPEFGLAVFGALYPADSVSAFILSGQYQNVYEDRDDEIVCKPVITNPDQDCENGPSAPPENVERLNLSGEYRRVFSIGSGRTQIGISPKGTVDSLSGDYSLEFPLYIIPDWDLPVAPGLTVSYSSDQDKFAFGVFMRASFTLGD